MKITSILAFAVLAATIIGLRGNAVAAEPCCQSCWYGSYSHVGWGAPVTLLVPPTAKYQTNWGWGVGNTRVSPIYPQFGRRGYATGASGPGTYQTTPLWPTDTTQFGVYHARGPW